MVLGVILGAILLLLFELNKAYAKQDFKWSQFVRYNILPFSINIVIGMIFIWSKDDLKDIYPITRLSSVMLGLSGQAIFKKLSSIFEAKIETHIGINENK